MPYQVNPTTEIQFIGTEKFNKTNEKYVNYHVLNNLNRKFPIINDNLLLSEENPAILRIKRFLAFLSFFIAFILFIFISSKFYSSLNRMKTRKKRYGYYFNMKLEFFLSDLKNRIKYKKIKENNLTHASSKSVAVPLYEKDLGHVNQSFDTHNELVIIDSPTSSIIQDSNELEEKREKKNFITKYFDQKRINSFEYDKFIDENDSLIFDNSNKNMNTIIKYFKRSKSKQKNESFKLFEIMSHKNNSHSEENSYIQFKKTKSLSNSSGFNESYSSSSTNNSTTFDLPVILITDTTKMHTIIIDLDSFEPEKLSYNDILFSKYRENEKRPALNEQ